MNQNKLFNSYEIAGETTKKHLDRYKNILGLNSTTLITGETGTGKELVARWIHFNDAKRSQHPFVKITIPNIGESIFESEIFGYEKGAFTGAITSKKGLIEVAENGSIFLDEIENASPSVQSKLLQLLEDRIYRKVGDTEYKKTDARFIIATNKDLFEEVRKNTFRADLFYRLAVIEIKLPPLRDRGHDIIEISNYYIRRISKEMNKDIKELAIGEASTLLSYPWPGNIRELKNFIEKAVIFSTDEQIDLSSLPKGDNIPTYESINFCYKDFIKEKEIELFKRALTQCEGNIENTSKLIGMSVPFVYKKLKELNISL